MSLNKNFKGKSVLVTGAGSGVGRALCQRLDSYGAKVYAVSRSKAPLDTLAKECSNVIPIALDIGASWDETRKVIDGMKDLDVVINNAAIVGTLTPFLDLNEDLYDIHSNVNLKAIVNISQTAAKNMIAGNKKGTIVNISSVAAFKAHANNSIYCTLKAGLDMLTKCMALELGKHFIRVNTINLGVVKTAALNRVADSLGNDEEKFKNLMNPLLSKVVYGQDCLPMDDVVNTILFTASDMANTLTGSCVVIDGGLTLS